ncbi:SDR family oxidoreductase [Candidatus Raskinella chloraquaticus]|jgi:NAD(P)-dependent dehydrogenase (short-subunit alcohol dehydrogenase family)
MSCWMITGAGRGIGLGIAKKILGRGDDVIALVRDPLKCDALRAIEGARTRLKLLAADVADAASLSAARAALSQERIDVLVNNAGIYRDRGRGILTADLDAFAETLMVNTVAPLRVLQNFAPLMGKGGQVSKVATISSAMGSFQRGDGQFSYRASKAGINKAIQSVAAELLQENIIAFVMHPGWVRTDMGGAGADISVEQSATGIIRTIDSAGCEAAGTFLNYDGTTIPW